jgi:GPH family glycoside/pentoside/hexuronide:cation symporter
VTDSPPQPAPTEPPAARGFNWTHFAWGTGSLGTITMISSISQLYLFFLVGVVQMSPVLAGFLIFISKMVDMVTDPLMGWISDRTNTRWGRRRPYMFVAAFACPLSLILLFSAPSLSGSIPMDVYVLSGLMFYAIVLTAYNVPYLAMPAEMTDDYNERSSIMSFRAVFLVGGGFVGSALAGLLIKKFGGGADAYQILSLCFGVVVFLSMMTAVVGTRRARFTRFVKPTIPTSSQFKLFFLNKPFLLLAAAKAFQFLQLAAGGATTLFFFIAVMEKDEGLLFPFGASVIVGSLLSLRLWLPIIKRFGKRETLIAALLAQAGLYLTWLLATPSEPMGVFIARAFLLGTMGGAVLICSQSMIVDTIEYDRKLSGINREGLYSSVFSFVEKSMYATGPLLIGVLLSAFGYDASIPRGQPQPDSALSAIIVGQAWVPAACSLFMVAVLLFYRLSESDLQQVSRHALGEQDKPAAQQIGDV